MEIPSFRDIGTRINLEYHRPLNRVLVGGAILASFGFFPQQTSQALLHNPAIEGLGGAIVRTYDALAHAQGPVDVDRVFVPDSYHPNVAHLTATPYPWSPVNVTSGERLSYGAAPTSTPTPTTR